MKCLKCGHDQKRGREGMTCTSCSASFTFDPKRDNRLTDSRMVALIERTSAHGRYPFFESQLHLSYAQFGKKLSGDYVVAGLFLAIFLAFGAMAWLAALKDSSDIGAIGMAIVSTLIVAASVASLKMTVQGKKFALTFSSQLSRWRASHQIEGLLADTSHRLEHKPSKTAEDDIYDYGVERVLLVSQAAWVDFFVLGGLHASQRCLVLSVEGYPHYLRPQLDKILQLQPSVPIFLLHDVHERPEHIASMAKQHLPTLAGKALMNISLRPGELWQLDKMKPLVRLCQAIKLQESLMLLPPQQVHSLIESAFTHRATLHELLRGQRDDSSSGFIGDDGARVGAFDMMVLSDFG